MDIIKYVFLGNSVLDYIICMGLFLAGVLVVRIVIAHLVKRFKVWAEKTATTFDDFLINAIDKIVLRSLYFGAFYLSINTLTLNILLNKIINILGIAVLVVVVVRLALEIIDITASIVVCYINGKRVLIRRAVLY